MSTKLIFRKGLAFWILILFIGLSTIQLTGAMKKEKNYHNTELNGLFYLRDDDPLNWDDVGSLLLGESFDDEITRCGMFVNFHFAQKGDYNREYRVFNIYYHFWQKEFSNGEYEVGYSTSYEHTAGFNESVTIDINDYKSDVDGYRLLQILQNTNPEIAVFNEDEVFNFTIKMFGPNPYVICSQQQCSFIIINLEDNVTLKSYDRDNDQVNDYEELFIYYTNPFDRDTDNDGFSDFTEVNYGADPNNYNDNFDPNKNPDKPRITGPSVGKAGVKYDYKFSTTDPEENDVFYYILWGDEQEGKWVGNYSSGEEITISHIWEKNGKYTIRAKAKDTNGAESEWSSLNVNIPKNPVVYKILQLKLLDQFPLINWLKFAKL
jgi:hypothetical protein